jgi:tellurite resistance-related uncharacterized protein
MASRKIVGFHRDDEGHWVADLECGHPQHVRHRPPMEERPWVQSEAGRQSMLGRALGCLYCNMPQLPEDVEVYNTSPEYDEKTIPEGLLHDHRTRAGVWGRIVVREGKLMYAVADPGGAAWVLRPGIDGFIAPGTAHWIAPHGRVRFVIEFLRVP